jgi:hypothetical protein
MRSNAAEVVTFRLPKDTLEAVNKYSAKNHITFSETVRRFIEKGLSIETYTEEQTQIRLYIRDELEIVTAKQNDRIIRILLKAAKSSATAMYACIAALADYFADDATYENVVAQALHQSAIYMRQKEEPFEKYLKEAKEMIHGAEQIGRVDDN